MSPTKKLLSAYRTYRERPRDRGAVIVEAALAIPILLLVIMGSIEFGFGWEARSATASAVRTGLLRAASIGDQPETDMRILQSIVGEVGPDNVERVEWVIIFERSATVSDDVRIADCEAGGGGNCVVYRTSFLQQVSATTDPDTFQQTHFDLGLGADPAGYTCEAAPKVDANWCASRRTEAGDIELGVALRYDHEWFTGIFPFDAPTFQETAVSSTFLQDGAGITPSGVLVPTGNVYSSNLGSLTPGSTPALYTHSGGGSGTVVAPGNAAHSSERYVGPMSNSTLTIGPLDAPAGEVCITFTVVFTGGWEPSTAGTAADHLYVDIGQNGSDADLATLNGNTAADGVQYDLPNSSGKNGFKRVLGPVCDTHAGGAFSIDLLGDVSFPGGEKWYLGEVAITN